MYYYTGMEDILNKNKCKLCKKRDIWKSNLSAKLKGYCDNCYNRYLNPPENSFSKMYAKREAEQALLSGKKVV